MALATIKLKRSTFSTSRLLEYFTERELEMQIGSSANLWPLMITKELIDNALDSCESASVSPLITVSLDGNSITVMDNGPGLPKETLRRSLDYSVRISDKAHYVAPTRGQLGNALKTLWAAPFVYNGEVAQVEVGTRLYTYGVRVSVDRIAQIPRLELIPLNRPFVKTGTFIKSEWRREASYDGDPGSDDFYKSVLGLLQSYAAFNPHAAFRLCRDGRDLLAISNPINPTWEKWLPSSPTSVYWYNPDTLSTLIGAYLTAERSRQNKKTVREFVSEFRGLSGTAKQKAVTDAAGLSGRYLHDLVSGGNVDRETVALLWREMCAASSPVKANKLGVIGESATLDRLIENDKVEPATAHYAKRASNDPSSPLIIEVAFGVYRDAADLEESERRVRFGLNFSPLVKTPAGVTDWLHKSMTDADDPVALAIHISSPRIEFTDKGKSTLCVDGELSELLGAALMNATQEWRQHKKYLRRSERVSRRALNAMAAQAQLSVKDAAYRVIEQAYMRASSNNSLPANARQVMYKARKLMQRLTDKTWKNDQTFTQNLLPDFVVDFPELTAQWDVVYDARGHIEEPHTRRRVDLGTLAVRRYVNDWITEPPQPVLSLNPTSGTIGPANRYKFALFIEKEGFAEILERAGIQRRYDIAIMSTKGMSTTASRQLIESLSEAGVTTLVAHDFDKSGLSICHTLQTDTRRFSFKQRPLVKCLGLRLSDVKRLKLDSESVTYKTDPTPGLLRSGATAAESAFLAGTSSYSYWTGSRVELNAMDSGQFVAWLEQKLKAHGVKKVVPDRATLEAAYRYAALVRTANEAIAKVQASWDERDIEIPSDLGARVRREITDTDRSWDEAIEAMR